MRFKSTEYSSSQIISLAVIALLLLMENIDANILNVAIPQMAITFATSVFTLKLAVTSYLIGLSVFIPISGWISDRFGTRNILLFSIVLFTLMSIQCGSTSSVSWLIFCRLLQGLAGAFMVPVARLLLLKIFAKKQMVKAYTLMGMPVLLGPLLAPILGGYLVSYLSWRWIFWVNVPLGVFALFATLKYIENYRQPQDRFNLSSYIFLALFLACACFWLDVFLIKDVQSVYKWLLLAAVGLFGCLYWQVEKHSQFPVIRYKLFKLRTFSTCFFATIVLRAALSGRAFVLAIFLEIAFKQSAFEAGFVFIYLSLGVLSSRTLVRKLLEKIGFRRTLTVANFGSFAALLLLGCSSQIGPLLYFVLFLNGMFAAAQFMSLNVLYYAEIETVDYGAAVSLAATWQQLGSSLGIIVAAGLLHLFNQINNTSFSINSFHFTFIGLAVINLACQFLIQRLDVADGQNLLGKHK